MTTCLICPSWAPCKCPGGPTQASLVQPVARTVPKDPIGSLSRQVANGTVPRKRINIRQKGASGEREIATAMNIIIQQVMREQGFPDDKVLQAANCVQRNQNQSAVGGNDLSHTFGMSIEVKRQEQLSINSWWKQCVAAAAPNHELPVLIYRQNKMSWSVLTIGSLHLPGVDASSYGSHSARVEFDWETFKAWFKQWVSRKLRNGELPRGVSA